MGRKTEEQIYANIALAIVLSFGLFALFGGVMFFIHQVILELPT